MQSCTIWCCDLPTSSQLLFRSQNHSGLERQLQVFLIDIQLPVHRTKHEASIAASEGKHDAVFTCSLPCFIQTRCLNALIVTDPQLSSRSFAEG